MEKGGKIYSDLVLYSYWRASCSWRVRIVLNLKGIKHTIKPINLLKSEHKGKEYLEVNKYGRIPVLEFKETEGDKSKIVRIHESTAIIDFLEEVFTDKPLLPIEDPVLKSKVKAICYHIACNMHPMQNLMTLQKVESIGYDKLTWAFEFLDKNLIPLEEEIQSTRGKYCFGDKITLADVYLIPQLFFYVRFNKPLTDYPNLKEIKENVEKINEFIDASPEKQIDSTN